MSEDRYANWLGDYVDGTLVESNRPLLEAHLLRCSSCRQTVEDLLNIRREARDLPRRTPPEAVWERIAASIGAELETTRSGVHHSWIWTHRWALAASFLIALGFLSAYWMWFPSSPPTTAADTAQMADRVVAELQLADEHYRNAISGLEQIVEKEKQDQTLSPEVMAVLNENLGVIEQAIGESRQAAMAQPENRAARESLLQALRSKLSLLQNTILLINEVRKGEADSAQDLFEKIRDEDRTSKPL